MSDINIIKKLKDYFGTPKCPECGAKQVRYPLYKEVDGKKVFIKENWPNLFKMDGISLMILLMVFFLMLGVGQEVQMCSDVLSDPCPYFNTICVHNISQHRFVGNYTYEIDLFNYTKSES